MIVEEVDKEKMMMEKTKGKTSTAKAKTKPSKKTAGKKTEVKEVCQHPYMLCSVDGFDRVPDTIVLLETEDWKLLMNCLKRAAAEDPAADIIVDPDDCGECYIELEEFMKHNISAKPIRAETYEDICHACVREHFGFNYVLDAVLETVFNVLGASLTPAEVKWLSLRSERVEWLVKEKEKNKQQSARVDKQEVWRAASGLKRHGDVVCSLVSLSNVDIETLREEVAKAVECAKTLESELRKAEQQA